MTTMFRSRQDALDPRVLTTLERRLAAVKAALDHDFGAAFVDMQASTVCRSMVEAAAVLLV